ncbi:MAG: hypothetical protein R3F54_29995 [Alphaproteobacteria bacterium]
MATDGPAALPELIAARAIVGLLASVAIVGSFRLVLAALGLDRGRVILTLEPSYIRIDGQAYDRGVVRGFELEPHLLARLEEHRDRQQKVASPLYFRDAYFLVLQYGDRRIEVAAILGNHPATKILARLQTLLTTAADAGDGTDRRLAYRT